jgi:hypothetical protein
MSIRSRQVLTPYGSIADVRRLVEHLDRRGIRCHAGLTGAAVGELERALYVTLPEPVHDLYRVCGGMTSDALVHLPMRLMSPAEVIGDAENFLLTADTYDPSPQAVYLFTDDSSNWAGIFVTGPLVGKVLLLDHDEPIQAPRFRSLEHFVERLVGASGDYPDWADMRTDYPLTAQADADMAAEALPLAHNYLDQYHAAVDAGDVEAAIRAAEMAMYLLPPTEWAVLRALLRSPYQYVRWTALRMAAVQQTRDLVPDIVAYARAARADGNDTHWWSALTALTEIGADDEIAALKRAPGEKA